MTFWQHRLSLQSMLILSIQALVVKRFQEKPVVFSTEGRLTSTTGRNQQ